MSAVEPQILSSDSEDVDDGSTEAIKWKADFLRSLNTIKAFGNFSYVKQHEQFTNPGLEVAGSLIPLPLIPRDADNIRALSQQAPFGRGEETVVDTTVRKTWELTTDQFRCSNPRWDAYLNTVVQEAAKNLGMPQNVQAEPYKLLLYEEGSFFKRHKDSEKAPGMIGTLVICLPSKHEGGDVHLSHAGKNCMFATSKSSTFDLTALAWYSDVTHEIKEITSGYRLVLTYNIIQGQGSKTSAGFFDKQQSHLQSLIDRWRQEFPKITKLVYRLEHKYSQKSLSLRHLKGRDAARVQSLSDLCTANGFYILLTRLTKTEAVGEYADDYDEDSSLTLDYLCSCDGIKVGSYCSVKIGDILGRDPYADRNPDSEDDGEITGNDCQPSEYRYHDSAVVIVPREHLKQFAGSYRYGEEESVNMLAMISKDLLAHLDDTLVRSYVTDFMNAMLEKSDRSTNRVLALMLKQARVLKDSALYQKVIRKAATPYYVTPNYQGTIIWPPSAISNTKPRGLGYEKELIPTIGEICNDISAPQMSDWDDCLGPLVIALETLLSVSEALNIVGGILNTDELRQSFLQWCNSAVSYRFNNKDSLQMDDLDLVMSLVTSNVDDSEWIDTRLTPKLKQCADRTLLYKLLDNLFQKSESGSLKGADVVAGRILEATLPKLKLTIDDFLSSAMNTGPYGGSSSSWDYATSIVANFVKFLDIFLKYNFTDLAKQLLELSCSDVAEAFRKAPPKSVPNMVFITSRSRYPSSTEVKKIEDMSTSFASKVLESLIDVAQKHQLAPLAPLKELFEIIVRKYVLADAPTHPAPRAGWAHKARGCDPYRNCPHCPEMNQFLLAGDQARVHFQRPAAFRTHVERQLPKEFFRCESGPSPSGGCYTLTITKLGAEYQDDVDQFLKKVAGLDEHVRVFATSAREYVERLLGAELFRELVLLEKIRQPPPPPPPAPAPAPMPTLTQGGDGVTQPQGSGPAPAITPAAPTSILPTPSGYAMPAVVPSGSHMPTTNAQIPTPAGPAAGTGRYLLPHPAPPQSKPSVIIPHGMMMIQQPQQPSYHPPVSLPPMHYHHHQNGPLPPPPPPGSAAQQQSFVLPPLQPTTGNAGGLKRRADDTWERPEATKARTSEFIDLTDG